MANFQADNAANVAAVPQARNKANKQGGRIRWFESVYTAPASGTPQIGDTIEFGTLPTNARVIGPLSSLNCSAGTASSTLAIGDGTTSNKYLAATSIASAANTALANPANGAASVETTDSTTKLYGTVAGAAVAAGQVITLRVAYVVD